MEYTKQGEILRTVKKQGASDTQKGSVLKTEFIIIKEPGAEILKDPETGAVQFFASREAAKRESVRTAAGYVAALDEEAGDIKSLQDIKDAHWMTEETENGVGVSPDDINTKNPEWTDWKIVEFPYLA